jgi:hypothetical protein
MHGDLDIQYGSNIGLKTLQEKKNLNPSRFLAATIKTWELYFSPGIPHVEPGFAAVRANPDAILHGRAFSFPKKRRKVWTNKKRPMLYYPADLFHLTVILSKTSDCTSLLVEVGKKVKT